jgi:L-threonylcarbamoyladenylate synthase
MSQTLLLDATKPADIALAAKLLREGELVAFPTETVYGLGANALSAEAVAGIFVAKQRPAWDPLIVHLASAEGLEAVAKVPGELVGRVAALVQAFWPGPLTLLLPRSEAVPDAVTAGRELVGVRVPAHPAALALLAAAGVPVAAPSANRFGHTSPTTAQHVLDDLDGRIAAVLDDGPTAIGVESTVLDPTQTPMVLYRPGAVSAEELTAITGVAVTVYVAEPSEKPEALPSPGVGIRHYAPRARLVLIEPTEGRDAEHSLLERNGLELATRHSVGLMLPNGWAILPKTHMFSWGDWNQPKELAARLFAGLRELDDLGVEVILCPLPEAGGLGDALRDRLMKAARSK